MTGTVSPAPRLLPMLAGGSGVPTDADKYQFEPKLDGQRIIAVVEDGVVTLTNRRGQEATATFPELRGMAGALGGHDAVLDGEVVTFDADGRTSFQRLQRRMHVVQPGQAAGRGAGGLRRLRRALVRRRVAHRLPPGGADPLLGTLGLTGSLWQTAPVLDATPGELLEACRQAGVEGFMAKRRDALYLPGKRSSAWSKVKCGRRGESVVGGWSTGQGGREGSIGSLALGVYDVAPEDEADQRLFYVGQAGSGLSEETIRQLDRLFAEISVPTSPSPTPRRSSCTS